MNAKAVNDAIDARRVEVARLRLRGHSMQEIAGLLGVSKTSIHDDLVALRAEWRDERVTYTDLERTEQLAKLNEIERESWGAWEFSKRTAEKKVMTNSKKFGRTKQVTRASQHGDPRFLEQIGKCIERRCKILGLDAPEKVAETNADGSDLSLEQRRARLMDIVDKLRRAAAITQGLREKKE